jgi:heme-degrading monooxygenase HmoA
MSIGPRDPLVCIRTVQIPAENLAAFEAWIESNRALRQRYGILMERILRPSSERGEWLIITMWESEEAFERWLLAPEKPALDASPGHALVQFGKIVRYDTVAGY